MQTPESKRKERKEEGKEGVTGEDLDQRCLDPGQRGRVKWPADNSTDFIKQGRRWEQEGGPGGYQKTRST